MPNPNIQYWMDSAQNLLLQFATVQCVLSIVKPGLKDMFFIVIFGGTVEITFLAHIIDVDVSDLGFSWNRTSIEWLRSSPLCCKIWTALWFSNNLSYPISSNSFLQIFCDPPKVIPLQNPAWKFRQDYWFFFDVVAGKPINKKSLEPTHSICMLDMKWVPLIRYSCAASSTIKSFIMPFLERFFILSLKESSWIIMSWKFLFIKHHL